MYGDGSSLDGIEDDGVVIKEREVLLISKGV